MLPGVTGEPPIGLQGKVDQIAAIPPAQVVLLGGASPLGTLEPPFFRAFGYLSTDGTVWEESAAPPVLGGASGVSVADLAIVP